MTSIDNYLFLVVFTSGETIVDILHDEEFNVVAKLTSAKLLVYYIMTNTFSNNYLEFSFSQSNSIIIFIYTKFYARQILLMFHRLYI